MKTKRREKRWMSAGAVILLVVGTVAAAKLSTTTAANRDGLLTTPVVYTQKIAPPVSEAEAARAIASAKDLSTAFRVAADRVLPSLVTIETTATQKRPSRQSVHPVPGFEGRNPLEGTPFEEMFRDHSLGEGFRFESPKRPNRREHGLGSGVIIDASGLIMTNNHVVAGGKSVRVMVRLSDGREFVADDVWTDPKTDIAVINISGASDLVPARLSDSDQVSVGDWVLALGQPFGLESTVTAGIISATHRGVGINARESFLQTDAAINPGNSGGPLVNLDGQVVGINTAISSRGGGNDGVGFAVPINLAKWVADQLSDTGTVRRAYLGIGIQPIDAKLAEQFGVKPRQGVLVTDVYLETPAAKSGLKPGDIIVQYAGVAVSSPQELQMIVERSQLGHRHELTVNRDGQTVTLKFTPEEQPKDFGERIAVGARRSATPGSKEFENWGIELSELTPDVARQLDLPDDTGVVITDIQSNSAAERAGLEPGMVVLEIDHQQVDNVTDCEALMKGHDGQRGLLLRVRSRQGTRFVVLKR